MITERVRHKNRPAEPWGKPSQQGVITKTKTDGRLRIAPGKNGVPAVAHCEWEDPVVGVFTTWERVCDLVPLGKVKK